MSFLLAAVIVASAGGAAAVVGRWLARRSGAPPVETSNEETSPAEDATEAAPARERAEVLDGFPCQLGDVVTRRSGEEAWLAGALVLQEELPVAVLFVAPEAGADIVLYARPSPRTSLFWMTAVDPSTILVGGEPPTSLEHQRLRFERVRRLPLRASSMGTGAPEVGDGVIVAEYASVGSERIVVVKGNSGAYRAFRGVELAPSSYEVVASGRSTLGRRA